MSGEDAMFVLPILLVPLVWWHKKSSACRIGQGLLPLSQFLLQFLLSHTSWCRLYCAQLSPLQVFQLLAQCWHYLHHILKATLKHNTTLAIALIVRIIFKIPVVFIMPIQHSGDIAKITEDSVCVYGCSTQLQWWLLNRTKSDWVDMEKYDCNHLHHLLRRITIILNDNFSFQTVSQPSNCHSRSTMSIMGTTGWHRSFIVYLKHSAKFSIFWV